MKAPRPVLGIWSVAVLILAAMLAPQINGSRPSESASSGLAIRRAAAVGYARVRLWTEFLETRTAPFNGHELPAPTLSEYRRYLRSVGLWEHGDEVSLVVFPAFERAHGIDRVDVVLASDSDPVELRVSIWENEKRLSPAGVVTIHRGNDGGLVCRAEQAARPAFWSYWPITPQPILP